MNRHQNSLIFNINVQHNFQLGMAKRTSGKTSAPKKKAAKKKTTRKETSSKKAAKAEKPLTKTQQAKALKKLSKIGARPSHPTKHLGPVLPLDMGPPEKPKKRVKRSRKTISRKP
jgi:hypothetical protein